MKPKIVVFLILAVVICNIAGAQCGDALVERAISELNKNNLFIKEFKVKLKEGTARNPMPSGKFTAFLQENNHYRFTVSNASEFEGKAILQLSKASNLLGSSYDEETGTDYRTFDFNCSQSGNYQVVMSFVDGKAGCAVGLLSVVLPDSLLNAQKMIPQDEYSEEALYLGVENTLFIFVDTFPGDKITYKIDQGELIQRNDSIFALPDHTGSATITVSRYGNDGKLKEEGHAVFPVTKIPPPYVTLEGLSGGIFSGGLMQSHTLLHLQLPQVFIKLGYKVIQFSVFPGDDFGKMSSIPDHFGDILPMMDIIKVMDPSFNSRYNTTSTTVIDFSRVGYGKHFTIANIKIRDREGKTYMAPNLVFEWGI
jgi:hypothetical protein